jgi:hypothetical protein
VFIAQHGDDALSEATEILEAMRPHARRHEFWQRMKSAIADLQMTALISDA